MKILPGTFYQLNMKPDLHVYIWSVDKTLVWFSYLSEPANELATPINEFAQLFSPVELCKTNPAKKSFFSKIGSLFRRFFSISA